ncbi:hypothetical protein P4361_11690 [Fictibacillus sp. B-59209]|uniref:hypothetical protein n=1 Tax=Fictibacillus sp. B-59209 TaxID=3024873 RepID=UPI002E1AE632|nr:hypothetical protein [Fictibacillus sp. B-59209]
MSSDIVQQEKNVYSELELLLNELTKDVVNEVIKQVVSSPFSQLYKKYDEQIPLLVKQNDELRNLTNQLNLTSKNLYDDMYELVGDVSREVIEHNVINKLKSLYDSHEKQILTLGENANKLDNYVSELIETEKFITNQVKQITGDVGENLLKNHIMLQFEQLFNNYKVLLPNLKNSQELLSNTIVEFSNAEETFQKWLQEMALKMVDQVTQIINLKLNGIKNQIEAQVSSLEEKLIEINDFIMVAQIVEKDLRETTNKLEDKLLSVEDNISEVLKETNKQFTVIKKENSNFYDSLNSKITRIGGAIILLLIISLFF